MLTAAQLSRHFRAHAPTYVGLAAVIGTVMAGHLQAQGVLETGEKQAASILEATRIEAAGRQDRDRAREQVTRYGELIQSSARMRFLMQRFERLDTKSRRDPTIVAELMSGTDDLAAKANSAAVILQSHESKAVRENSHGIAFTMPYAAQCLETGLPGNTNGYRVDYPGRGLTGCGNLREWLEVHEGSLAKEAPTFS
ncbi:hypothetical protein ACGF8B_26870 [Streptomyces sp. NPDC047917]|uniref:hypothetical protein n=1 Tax=Streptomyces sp. NPDC047917 TaxID=3365491 RepID=UPI0037241B7B